MVSSSLFSLDNRGVNVKTQGRGEKIEKLDEVKDIIKTFAPMMDIPMAGYNDLKGIRSMSSENNDKSVRYNSAKIVVNRLENKTCWQNITYYISGDIMYALCVGDMKVEKEEFSGNDYTTTESYQSFQQVAYYTEIYRDRDNYLIRFLDSFNYLEESLKNNEGLLESNDCENIPKGLKRNTWYHVDDIMSAGLLPVTSSLDSTIKDILDINNENFIYHHRGDEIEQVTGWGLLTDGLYRYQAESSLDESSEEKLVTVVDIIANNSDSVWLMYSKVYMEWNNSQNGYGVKFEIRDVNATVVKKLINPQIGEIDFEMLNKEE